MILLTGGNECTDVKQSQTTGLKCNHSCGGVGGVHPYKIAAGDICLSGFAKNDSKIFIKERSDVYEPVSILCRLSSECPPAW